MAVHFYQQFQIISQPDPADPEKIVQLIQPGSHALFAGGVVMDVAIGLDAITVASLQQSQDHQPLPSPIVVKALLDTGCNVTSIDKKIAETLNLKVRGYAQVYTANGLADNSQHLVSFGFPGTGLKGINVLNVQTVNLTGQPFGILIGRDIMSNWAITYNGPAGFVSIAD